MGLDVRSFNVGRRSSCLKVVLLALVLNAPISLNAQSGSSTQSQSHGTPACSNAPPILKRGRQPDLPPCPEPPVAAAPADSVRTRSLSPSEALIERARQAAFEFSQKLPNFICKEVMARYSQRGREETPLDIVSAEIIYDHAKESYRNVKINDRPTDTSLEEISGSRSTGEFASTLLELFHPDTNARFRSSGTASSISGLRGQVYDFEVGSENSHWRVQADSHSMVAAYGGSVWVDPSTARVLRIEMQARNIPSDFPMDTIESAVDYSYVSIGGTSVLLPVHAESLGCRQGASHCSHNIIDFRNYHEFRVDVKIGSGQGP